MIGLLCNMIGLFCYSACDMWTLHRWRHEVSRKQAHQALLVQYLLRSMRRAVARGWTLWSLYVLSSRHLRVCYRRAVLRVSYGRRALAFDRWKVFAQLQVTWQNRPTYIAKETYLHAK